MKLMNMIIFLVVIQAVILVYDQVYATEGDAGYLITPYDSNDSTIWNFILDPTGWTGTGLLTIFAGLIGLVGAIGIGVYMYTKSDTVLFFGVFTLLLGFGSIPIISLYHVLTRNVSFFGCAAMPCTPAILAWVFTGGIIAIMYVMACLEWWSGRSVG